MENNKINKGRLGADTTQEGDEKYTPFYAVEPIIKYLENKKYKRIWLPFDQEWSAYNQRLKELGYEVETSHIAEGKSFFEYEPNEFDAIVSNPPYSIKDEVLKRLAELNKPFAMLVPLETVQGQKRFESLKDGIQMLAFDKRIGFHNKKSLEKPVEGTPFPTVYLCRNILPSDLIIERLDKFERPLIVA